ncbi:MAG: hypothetical protein ACD_68C00049G0001, partial [uncultured bacterium]
MTVLFITRTFSNKPGGMARMIKALINHLPLNTKTIALKYSARIHLVWFLPYAFCKALFSRRSYDVIHLGDGVLAPLGWFLKVL